MAHLERRVILVAGMHRSGTSATARVLNLLGAEIPGEVVPGSHGNERGHWEPQTVVDIHDRMLRSAGTNVNSVFGVDDAWFGSPAAEQERRGLAEFLRQAFDGTPLAVVKDPRLALFTPIWRGALEDIGAQASFVFPFRDPVEVAASLRRRQAHFYPDAVWPLGRGVLLWLRYVLAAEKGSRGSPRAFVSFDALLADWRAETTRIGRQLGLEWPKPARAVEHEVADFLSHELKHETQGARRDEFALAYGVLDQLAACVGDPAAGQDMFSAALRRLDEATALFRDYVAALEVTLGANPRLRTEFVDFMNARASEPPRAQHPHAKPDPLDGFDHADPERGAAMLLGARSRSRVQAARIAELETFNEALLGAARITEAARSTDIEAAASAAGAAKREAEAVRRQLDEARSAHAAAEAQKESTQQEIDCLRADLAGAESRAAALEGASAAAMTSQEALAEQNRRLSADKWTLQAEIQTLRDRMAEHDAPAAALADSGIQRLTAPARALLRSLRSADKAP